MKIEKALINNSVRVSEVLRKFCIPTIYNFAEFTRDYFLTVSIVLSVYKQTLPLNNLKTRTAVIAKISVFVIGVEAIIYLLLYDLHETL